MSALTQHVRIERIDDDDATIEAALAEVSVPALIASVVQLTGDPALVRGSVRPREFVLNEFQGKMTEDEKAWLRGEASRAIVAWRDAGCPAVEPLGNEIVREVMDWIACTHVTDEYADLYTEEMDLEGSNPRAFPIAVDSAGDGPPSAELSVLVIGCGEAGLLAGIRLKEAGIPFEIIEKNDDVGGTWLENTYPGCRVDVASHFYSYSFGPNDQFSEYYAQQPELYPYFRTLLDGHGVAEHVRWRREVLKAQWDDGTARWEVTSRAVDGSIEMRSANVLMSGVGILNRPLIPQLANLDRFRGPVFHSARWDHSVDIAGKRVALIGAGASGFQIGPAIVDEVDRLVVFQRTPQWMAPNPRYHAPVTAGERWAMRHLPGYSRWYRFMLMWQSSDKLLEMVRIDPEWADFPRTCNQMSADRRDLFVRWIERLVGDDPALMAKVTPDYPPMAKRMLQDNGSWLKCLTRDHVELERDEIIDIDETAVITDHARHEVDVIILATGFRASEVLWPMEIVGRDGVSIAEVWDGKPSAFLGISLPGFPNFFILNGPGTGLAHAGSVILMNECQLRYVGDALRIVAGGECRSIEPTTEAYDRYRDALQAEVGTLMWGHPSIEHSWYKAADGNVYIICPWRMVDYWQMTAAVDPDDHLIDDRRPAVTSA